MYASNYQEQVDKYILRNGYDDFVTSDKERKKILKDIIQYERVNMDFYDLKRSNGALTADEYIKLIHKSVANMHTAIYYIGFIDDNIRIRKDEKKEIKKAKIKQIIKTFFEE